MTVELPLKKRQTVVQACEAFAHTPAVVPIREVARTIGVLVSTFPAVPWGPLHFRSLEREKTQALIKNRGNYDGLMTLNMGRSYEQLQWWINNIYKKSTACLIAPKCTTIRITSDACLTGWGGTAVIDGQLEKSTAGQWQKEEKDTKNINFLEMKAALYTLKALCHNSRNTAIALRVDNTAAVGAIRNMGSRSQICDEVISELWEWARIRDLWITVTHIPGVQNTIADAKSRQKHKDELEWALNPTFFNQAMAAHNWRPNVDLFASRLNYKVKTFYSLRADPEAYGCDAFTVSWRELKFYAFPPFPLIQRVLRKVQADEATGVVIVPDWPTRPWYPMLTSMLISDRYYMTRSTRVLTNPAHDFHHPLAASMTLTACLISGDSTKVWDYQMRQ